MKCSNCGKKLQSINFPKTVTKSGNNLGITITKEIQQALDLKYGDLLDVKITKL